MTWPYPHPPRGTCRCGCGRPTKKVWAAGHNPVRRVGCYGRTGVELDRLRPMLHFLRERYGTWRAVADLLDMAPGTMWTYMAPGSRKRRVPPETARKIAEAVIRHRTPADPFADYEDRRLALPHERRVNEMNLPKPDRMVKRYQPPRAKVTTSTQECRVCGQPFERRPGEGAQGFALRSTCGSECWDRFRRTAVANIALRRSA